MGTRKLHYPKMASSRNCPGGRCIAFEKYDGTNIHFAWDRDFGWHAFGTRRDEFNLTPEGVADFARKHVQLSEVASVFESQLKDGLTEVIHENSDYDRIDEIVAFAEFHGPNSFAGAHRSDDSKCLTLFDVQIEGFGLIGPEQFARDFGHLESARVVYRGKFTGAFAEAVRNGEYKVTEGVVCKGGTGGSDLWMAKIKTNAYLSRLKASFGEKWQEYWE